VSCKHENDGRCSLGLYGGRPSPGVCHNVCEQYDGPSRGLGDTVAKALKTVGVQKRKGCKCGKRQAKLNRMVTYGNSGVAGR
jgi:hypothetical protein